MQVWNHRINISLAQGICVHLWSPNKDTSAVGKGAEKIDPVIKVLKHLLYEERLSVWTILVMKKTTKSATTTHNTPIPA